MFRKDPNRRRSGGASRTHSRSSSDGSGAGRVGRSARKSKANSAADASSRFVLYVEGPRDRDILGSWARRFESGLARCIESNTVILGGRQPARAVRDFQARGGEEAGWTGLIVLDRDDHTAEEAVALTGSGRASLGGVGLEGSPGTQPASPNTEVDALEGLELFVWGRRHIESYLLVPAAIRRVLKIATDDDRVDQALANLDRLASSQGSVHAKRVLGTGGLLSEALGAELRSGEIARAMRREDFHPDVDALLGRIGTLAGVVTKRPEVVIRPPLRT